MNKRSSRPAVFFDRDGVLNQDTGYTHRLVDLHLIDGAASAVRRFNAAGWWVFVVSNQSGIARGYFDEAAVRAFNAALRAELDAETARIDAIYYCPHHPDGVIAAYAIACTCRKPKTGMIERALAEWPVDVSRSLLIGDRLSDMAAARTAGLRGLLFPGGNLDEFCRLKKIP